MAANPPVNNKLKPCTATIDQRKHLKPLTGHSGSQALFGGVRLNRTLPPLAKDLQKGAVFKEANLPKKIEKSGEWYKIPSWMAGIWHREMSTNILPSGQVDTYIDRMDHTWGQQRDPGGAVWHHRNEPFIETGETKFNLCTKEIRLQKPVLVTDSKVIILYKDLTVIYSKFGHIITHTYQHEELAELTKRGDNLCEEFWDRSFDQNGKPIQSGHGSVTNTKIAAFQPIDFDKKTGIDLKKDFAIYISNHKLSNRIPTNYKIKTAAKPNL